MYGQGLRNACLISFVSDGMLRTAEAAVIQFAEVHPRSGTGTLTIPRSESDPKGEGADVVLSRRSMDLFREYTLICEITGG